MTWPAAPGQCDGVDAVVNRFEVLSDILEQRYSCRAFRPDPVPRAQFEAMFGIAQRTASWCNAQPWQVALLSGDALERFRSGLVEMAEQGGSEPHIDFPASYDGVYAERRRECGLALYQSVGIARDDMERRREQHMDNFRLFGAPHVAVISTARNLGTYGAVDCGGYVSNLLNAATSLGIASIPQAAPARYGHYVADAIGLSGDRLIVCVVSFGYADTSHPVNGFRTSRAGVPSVVSFLD
ncbi:MAG: nitroreductase [Alphaproteobacteria bacterium]|nr:nitroreductase [Alphaproteobacteria bacterium]